MKKETLKNFSSRAIALCYITLIFTFSIPKFTSFNYNPNMDLTKLAPHLATFVISFVTIAAFGVAQGRIVNLIPEINKIIIWQYRAYFVCLVLVSIAAVSLSSDPFAKLPLIIYASLLLAVALLHVGLLYSALKIKAEGHNYLISGTKASLKLTALAGPLCYLLVIAACFVNAYISFAGIIAAMFFYFFFMKKIQSAY